MCVDQVTVDILRARPKTPSLKNDAISYLDLNTKSFDFTRGVLCTLERGVREEISNLGGNAALEAILDILSI